MTSATRIKPISCLESNAVNSVKDFAANSEALIITQGGEVASMNFLVPAHVMSPALNIHVKCIY